MNVQPARREYRNWVMDSRRWLEYRPRSGDIVVATYPKCGTTWMQRIVNLLIFQSAEPRPVSQLSPWYDMRIGPPVDVMNEALEAQTHRRAIKTHLPLDGLPWCDDVRYIHVARDGRDACLSYHNHATGFTEDTIQKLDRAGIEDPTIGLPFERLPADPAQYFHLWLTTSRLHGFTDGYQLVSYFETERTYWSERRRENLLLVHYADLKQDLAGEMRRVAQFLDIDVREEVWPQLVDAASFRVMKKDGDKLMPNVMALFAEGAERFFHRGEVGRWRDLFTMPDLDLYQTKMATLPENCRAWLQAGRMATADPRLA